MAITASQALSTVGAIPLTILLIPWKFGCIRSGSASAGLPATPARKKG
jgi:hypothetical protein